MFVHWRDLVTDPGEIKIFEALEDPRWEWRTIGALARASRMSEGDVIGVLNKYRGHIYKSPVPNKKGESLFTLREKYYKRLSPLEKLWFFTDSTSAS